MTRLVLLVALSILTGLVACVDDPVTSNRSQTVVPPHLVLYPDLPAGLVIHRSAGRTPDYHGMPEAGVFLRTADSTAWYSGDYSWWTWSDPTPWMNAAFWGPFPSLQQSRSYLLDSVLTLLDTQGTDGSSDWLVLP